MGAGAGLREEPRMGTKLIGMSEDSQRSAGLSEDELVLLNDPCIPEAVKKRFVDLEARDHRERLRTMRMLLLRNRIDIPAEVIDAALAKVAEMLRGNDPKSLREALRFVRDVAAHDLNVDRAVMEVVTQERDAEAAAGQGQRSGRTADELLELLTKADWHERVAEPRRLPTGTEPPAPPEAEPAGDGV